MGNTAKPQCTFVAIARKPDGTTVHRRCKRKAHTKGGACKLQIGKWLCSDAAMPIDETGGRR